MISFNTDTPVVVLGASHNPALGVARSLGRHGVRLIGIGTDPHSPIHASRYFSKVHQWDVVRQPVDASLKFLNELGRSLQPRPLILATYDDGVIFLAQHAGALAEAYHFPRQPPDLIHAFCNKRALYELATRLNIPTPLSAFPENAGDVETFIARSRFPVVVKGMDGPRLERRCGLKHFIVHNADELRLRYREREDPAAPNLMLQEFIPGTDADMWLFNGYFDEHARCRLAFTGRKLRQAPIHSGAASFGVCTWNQTIADQAIALMQAVGYAGMLDVDYRFDHRDNQYKLLDPNPRVGSTFRLFATTAGLDVALAFYLHMTGQALPDGQPIEGRTWVSEDTDALAAYAYWREGSLDLSDWLKSRRGVSERAWMAPDDLRPFWKMGGRFARLIGRVAGKHLAALPRKLMGQTTKPKP